MKGIRMTQKTNGFVYSDGITKLVYRYTKRNEKWCYRVEKNVLKEYVLIFVKTLGTYTKQHNTCPEFSEKKAAFIFKAINVPHVDVTVVKRGTVSTV
jgi:hypothetical protein